MGKPRSRVKPYPWRRLALVAAVPLVAAAFVVSAIVPAFNGPPPLPRNIQDIMTAHPGLGKDPRIVQWFMSHGQIQWFEMTAPEFVQATGWGAIQFYSFTDRIFLYVALGHWETPSETAIRIIESNETVSLGQIQGSLGGP